MTCVTGSRANAATAGCAVGNAVGNVDVGARAGSTGSGALWRHGAAFRCGGLGHAGAGRVFIVSVRFGLGAHVAVAAAAHGNAVLGALGMQGVWGCAAIDAIVAGCGG